MMELKTPGEIDAIAAAGTIVAETLAALRNHARPGIRGTELDQLAAQRIFEAGATSSFRGYHPGFAPVPYPAVLCISVNDAVVHGIPGPEPLADGDLVSLDFAVHLDGWCADAAISTIIGTPEPADHALISTTEQALETGIAAAVPGARMGDIAHAISQTGRAAGYGLLADHGGHGVGRAMHEPPSVPNQGRAGRGLRLRPGLVLALEPMLTASGHNAYQHDRDGWTIRTADHDRAAHAEHTIAITDAGPRILTDQTHHGLRPGTNQRSPRLAQP
jgi:methionyl aminopeptidase